MIEELSIEPMENRAVSPAIGIALMAVITVVLASLVGAGMMGYVSLNSDTPSMQFALATQNQTFTGFSGGTDSTDEAMPTVEIDYKSGDVVSSSNLHVSVSGNRTEPQRNASVYDVEYNGAGNPDDWRRTWGATLDANARAIQPGGGTRAAFYGINETKIDDARIADYNITDADDPGEGIRLFGSSGANTALKLSPCDTVRIVWRASSGDGGEEVVKYQVEGAPCV